MESIISFLQSGFSAIIPFIVLLGILIFVHELGHFLVAKWCGVRVEVFSLGFGKKILQYKKGDTTYCISLIPLGGYVKMFGDEFGSKISEEDKKHSFSHKNVWQRIAVVLAGPLMNFFFAILVFMIVAQIGEDFRKPMVGDIPTHSSAFEAGFRSGDVIQAVDDKPVQTWDQFQKLISEASEQKVRVAVTRYGSGQEAVVEAVPHLVPNPNLLSLDDTIGEIEGLSPYSKAALVAVKSNSVASQWGLKTGDRILSVSGQSVDYFRELENILLSFQGQNVEIGIERPLEKEAKRLSIQAQIPAISSMKVLGIENPELYIGQIVPDSPAAVAGLLAGDKLIKVHETQPMEWEDVLAAIKSYPGTGALAIGVDRDGTEKTFEIEPRMTSLMTPQGAEEKRFTIGIKPMLMIAPPAMTKIKTSGLGSSLVRGTEKTLEITGMTVLGFLRLIQNKISPKNIGGVISIGQAASETFKIGISQFLQMMAIISVNLFVLNLLPIPVLDGGHLLFYSIEALKGAPLSMRKIEIAQQVGLVILVSLMVFALFNDFSRNFGFW